jgi:hypothetical protein
VISIARPGAAGRPAHLYSVNAVRRIQPDQTGFDPWPSALAIDNHGHVLTSVERSNGNGIEVFQGGPGSSNKPIRTISGPHTGLGACSNFDSCTHIAIAYSALTGRIYAAVSDTDQSRVEVFAGNANGDARTIRTIAGTATGLKEHVVTGIAVSQRTGDIFVLAKSAEFQGTGTIEVFRRVQSGNTAPLRTFTDKASHMADGQGIALSP